MAGGETLSDRTARESPLLETKLRIPTRRRGALPRPRLRERLDLGAQAKLTLVSAPPGFGKTTLLAEWLVDDVCVTRARDWPFRKATPHDATPDILNGVYMFATAHLETYFRLCRSLAIEDQARFGNGEDIVLSHCGASRPRKIEVGRRLRCMSSGMPGIAISMSRRDAFFAERWRIFRALRRQDAKWSCRSIADAPRW